MRSFCFDSSNIAWGKNDQENCFFISMMISHIKDILRYRGYVYLNDIYELFNVTWNPDDENICYKDPRTFFIDVESDDNGGYLIKVD